ncbi:hypothetical protein CROQUDRAFT_679429 [Cronartium quercuum f. sp. fusiforme G11]|uniref:Uncharacterized protein n=1 Tax=Cronartium quercuum f. sp. fusiforme G11 TaxID=708437 RepID=A0A9P6NUI5_9BASI|nr:hypothetical protein CROQUDRAFT_679429 [Cronartium quercuum f. sp. fusiforme G11]
MMLLSTQNYICIKGLKDEKHNFVLDALKIDPTLYLDELVAALLEGNGLVISTTTLATELNYHLKWTRKKIQTIHLNPWLHKQST